MNLCSRIVSVINLIFDLSWASYFSVTDIMISLHNLLLCVF